MKNHLPTVMRVICWIGIGLLVISAGAFFFSVQFTQSPYAKGISSAFGFPAPSNMDAYTQFVSKFVTSIVIKMALWIAILVKLSGHKVTTVRILAGVIALYSLPLPILGGLALLISFCLSTKTSTENQ
ncbi:MAG: hypothetical protein P4L87_11490 [Formivibrio sp.]|nr:hypothetical protein [Formivibrio sp.]